MAREAADAGADDRTTAGNPESDADPETPTGSDPIAESPETPDEPETPAELLARARRYARRVPIDVDPEGIEWEISHRAKRRAGACLFHPDSGRITIRLTWAAYEAFGWERFAGTIRHELIHALEFGERGESGHGPFFERWAERLDAPRHCPRFSPPAYWIRCADCGHRSARYRRSKVVTDPERYRCGSCGGRLTVEEAQGTEEGTDEDRAKADETAG